MPTKLNACSKIDIDTKLFYLRKMKLEMAYRGLLSKDMIYSPSEETKKEIKRNEGVELPNDSFMNIYKKQRQKKRRK